MILTKCPNCGNAVLLTSTQGVSHAKCCSCGYELRLADCKSNEALEQSNISSIENIIPIMEEQVMSYDSRPNDIQSAADELGLDCNVLIELLNVLKKGKPNESMESNTQCFVTLEPRVVSVNDINSRLDVLDEGIKQISHPTFGVIHSQTNDEVLALKNEITKITERKLSVEEQLIRVVEELRMVKDRLSKYEIL